MVASGETVADRRAGRPGLWKKRRPRAPLPPPPPPSAEAAPTALHAEIRRLEAEFDAAVAARDVDAAVRAVLELDDTLVAWSGDTTQSDAGERGRAAMRRMIVRLGELARTGARDPREVVGGFVEALLAERAAAREDVVLPTPTGSGTSWRPSAWRCATPPTGPSGSSRPTGADSPGVPARRPVGLRWRAGTL